jgi:hypothetical protein
MYTFKDYLMESKKTYSFKVKVCGEVPKDALKCMKDALAKFDPVKVSSGKRTPIQERPLDFPGKSNVEVTVFDVELNYPTNSPAVREVVASCLNMSLDCVKARTPGEEMELEINQAHMAVPGNGEALLNKDYETNSEAQDKVGDKHVSSFLKELQKASDERKKEFSKTEKTEKVKPTAPEKETPTDGRNGPLSKHASADPRKGK